MKKLFAACATFVLTTLSLQVFAAEAPKANFTISAKSAIPGLTLEPGKYSIQVVGQLADRIILKVDDVAGKTHTDFIGIRSTEKSLSAGVTNWSTPVDNATYIRGWVPPGSSTMIEFVYPKNDAVSIAKVNQAKVPAIDPASEGRSSDPTLSSDDMKLVTLWLLSSTRVGPEDAAPSIKAERYQTASLVKQRPVIASLPHTASALPLIVLLSLLSLMAAVIFRQRRLSFN